MWRPPRSAAPGRWRWPAAARAAPNSATPAPTQSSPTSLTPPPSPPSSPPPRPDRAKVVDGPSTTFYGGRWPIHHLPGPALGPPGVGWAGPRCAAPGRGTMLVPMSSDEGSAAPAGHGYGATLWEPDAETVRNARISHYMRWLADRGIQAGNPGAPAGPGSAAPASVYQRLWEWSVANPGEFWTSIWDYFDVLGDRGDGPALTGTTMPDVPWFPDATLNYARNALRTAWTDPDRPAIIAVSERRGTAELSYAELAAEVARVARGLRALGVTKGDRVVALLPNISEAVIGLLATASIGA